MVTDVQVPNIATATEAFQNHETRLSALEDMERAIRQAFPAIADALGRPHVPRPYLREEGWGDGAPVVISTDKAIDDLNAKMDAILSRLSLPGPSAGATPPPAPGPTGPQNAMGSPQ